MLSYCIRHQIPVQLSAIHLDFGVWLCLYTYLVNKKHSAANMAYVWKSVLSLVFLAFGELINYQS